ncbi:MAG: helix-turn-helix domain-containing protein, partial [Candidatus Anammoxibacter sp.]
KNREIGGRIKIAREDMGISQTKLGDWIGVSYQQVQKYENGISTLSVDKLDKIANVLGASITYFFEGPKKKGYKSPIVKEESGKYLKDALKTAKLTTDEQILLRGYQSIKSKEIKRGLLLLLRGVLNTN